MVFLRTYMQIFDGRKIVPDAFQSRIFPTKIEVTGFSDFDHSNFKILTVIRQIIYSLYRAKEITEKIV